MAGRAVCHSQQHVVLQNQRAHPYGLGKEFAGRQVLVEQQEPGVWLVRTALVVPDNELWLHQPKARQDLAHALDRAQRQPAKESDLDATLKRLEDGGHRTGKKASTRSQ